MKKKTIAFLVIVSLLALPVMASAATEFTLGGYLKLHVFWDSAALGKNWNSVPARNNSGNGQHGRMQFTAQSSRFNFTIKGPEVWGAKTTGYLEVDFDQQGDTRQSASNSYVPRMRHAFFRMNWPDWELLMGQYWSYFCEFYPEMIQDGPFQGHGQATARLAQVRGTYNFGPGWAKDDKMNLSLLIGAPTDTNDSADPAYLSGAPLEGQTAETPQIQGKVSYEGDLWGKAGFYGRPKGFTAQISAGWQRTRYRSGDHTVRWFGETNFDTPAGAARTSPDQQYLNNWMVQGTLFIPIIPTHTQNLAGTMALSAQAYVGEGLDAFGNAAGFNSYFRFITDSANLYDRKLVKTWGGYVQANYYFNNEWFVNAAAGMGNNFGVERRPRFTGGNPTAFLATVDPIQNWWEVDFNVYYRPVTALKFGLGYAYTKAKYFQIVSQQNEGEAHRVQFAGWFFF